MDSINITDIARAAANSSHTHSLPALVHDDKYIVFKREDLEHAMIGLPRAAWEPLAIEDAVVIRRQDFFASPALATYASTIGLVAHTTPDQLLSQRLLGVADYFQRQSEAAAEQGYKFPD